MPLITDYYREQNKHLHESNESYGTSGVNNAHKVVEIANEIGTVDILDYGCGKGTLGSALTIPIKEYDPCIEGKDSPPEPADFVVCTDVLEHIEPDYLDDVLDDLQRLTKRVLLLVVAIRPAIKLLPDGRNAHLIIEPSGFWILKFLERWELFEFKSVHGEFTAVLKAKT